MAGTAISVLWYFWAFQISVTEIIAENEYQTICQYRGDIPDWTWIMFLSIAIFDIIILLLTLQTLFTSFDDFKDIKSLWKQWNSTKSNLSKLFYQDTLIYFLISSSITIFLLVWNYRHRQDQFYTALVGPM